jgi:hypothetical protein
VRRQDIPARRMILATLTRSLRAAYDRREVLGLGNLSDVEGEWSMFDRGGSGDRCAPAGGVLPPLAGVCDRSGMQEAEIIARVLRM